ncbi:MAG: acetate uptake transporter [Desulfovibrio sp.]|nr:acetate uptake transporter [Desulfovibrio sp.]MBI4958023.1 acetate uptake transporter [Desulfovibrio sp.]
MDQKTANPAPVGLLGFGMTTILLNIHNAGFFPVSAMILAMGIFYGGIAQVIAGILEYKKGNTFAYTAFVSYGMFWLTLVFLIVAPKWGITPPTEHAFMGWYLFVWGVFTLFMFIGTLNKGPVLKFIFGSLTVLFFLLAVRDWTGSQLVGTIAGWEGIVCGASAFYLGVAEVLEEARGRKILPF